MKKNMSILDRILRIIIAAAVAVLYFMGVLTGHLGDCPGYRRCDLPADRSDRFLPPLYLIQNLHPEEIIILSL